MAGHYCQRILADDKHDYGEGRSDALLASRWAQVNDLRPASVLHLELCALRLPLVVCVYEVSRALNTAVVCPVRAVNQGWPKYAQSVVQRSVSSGGLAIVVYAPANVTANNVGGGAKLFITTDYPFSDTIEIRVVSKQPFPLHLRIPAWVDKATIAVDEGPPQYASITGAFHTINKVGGTGGSVVVLTMHNKIRVEEGGYNDSSVSIHRGPLLFAMDIGNKVTAVNASNGGSPTGMDQFQEYQVEATKPWNMALDVDESALQFVGMTEPLGPDQPFSPDHAPVRIKARGRQLPQWGMLNYSASPPPMSPVHSTEPWQDLTFLPFGSTNIRIAQLPTLSPS